MKDNKEIDKILKRIKIKKEKAESQIELQFANELYKIRSAGFTPLNAIILPNPILQTGMVYCGVFIENKIFRLPNGDSPSVLFECEEDFDN